MSTSSTGTTDSLYSSVTSEDIIYDSDNKRNLTEKGDLLLTKMAHIYQNGPYLPKWLLFIYAKTFYKADL